MTVTSTTSKVAYIANGSNVEFVVPFKFFNNSDGTAQLQVLMEDEGGSIFVVSEEGNYVVAGAGEDGGGVITFLAPPANGNRLSIARKTSFLQMVNFLNGEDFDGEQYEFSLDEIVMGMQELLEKIDRAILLSTFSDENPNSIIETIINYKNVVINYANLAKQSADEAELFKALAKAWASQESGKVVESDGEKDYSAKYYAGKAAESLGTINNVIATAEGDFAKKVDDAIEGVNDVADGRIAEIDEIVGKIVPIGMPPFMPMPSGSYDLFDGCVWCDVGTVYTPTEYQVDRMEAFDADNTKGLPWITFEERDAWLAEFPTVGCPMFAWDKATNVCKPPVIYEGTVIAGKIAREGYLSTVWDQIQNITGDFTGGHDGSNEYGLGLTNDVSGAFKHLGNQGLRAYGQGSSMNRGGIAFDASLVVRAGDETRNKQHNMPFMVNVANVYTQAMATDWEDFNNALSAKANVNFDNVSEENARKLIGNRVWISAPYSWTANSKIVVNLPDEVKNAVGFNPEKSRAEPRFRCIVANNGYEVGEYMEGVKGSGDYGLSSNLCASINSSTISASIGRDLGVQNKTNGGNATGTNTQWALVFRVFY